MICILKKVIYIVVVLLLASLVIINYIKTQEIRTSYQNQVLNTAIEKGLHGSLVNLKDAIANREGPNYKGKVNLLINASNDLETAEQTFGLYRIDGKGIGTAYISPVIDYYNNKLKGIINESLHDKNTRYRDSLKVIYRDINIIYNELKEGKIASKNKGKFLDYWKKVIKGVDYKGQLF